MKHQTQMLHDIIL